MSAQFSHILFDLDGTLTESAPGIVNSVRHALAHFGIDEADPENLLRFVGPPLINSFMEFYGFSEERAREGMRVYRERYGEKGIFENSVYAGIFDALRALRAAGKKLYVATSKPEIYMARILDHYGLAEFFDFAGGSDEAETRARKADIIRYVLAHEHLDAERAAGEILMVGDRKHDILGARECGIPCAGCLWGYGSRAEFEEHGAAFIVGAPADLARLILD